MKHNLRYHHALSRAISNLLQRLVLLMLVLLPFRGVSQQVHHALYFDGTASYVNLDALAPALAAAPSITVEVKIRCDIAENDSARVNIFAINPDVTGQNKFALIMGDSGTVQSGLVSLYEASGARRYFTTDQYIGDNRCHHLCIIRDNVQTQLYVDGIYIASLPVAKTLLATDRVSLGHEYDFTLPSDFYRGIIDEVRVWNIARTPTEIQNNINARYTGNETGLLAWYDFDQGIAAGSNPTETTLLDATPNAFHGSLNNFQLAGNSSNWIRFMDVSLDPYGLDTTLCIGQTVMVSAQSDAGNFLWSTGETTSSIEVSNPETLWVTASENVCQVNDTSTLNFIAYPTSNSTNDTILCNNILTLEANDPLATSFRWDNNSTDSTRIIFETGIYWIQYAVGTCLQTDSIRVVQINPPDNLLVEKTFCSGETITLDGTLPFSTYLWSTQENTPNIQVNQPNTYTVLRLTPCGNSIITFEVKDDDCACYFYMPNSFTPNHDKYNNRFGPVYHCNMDDYHLRIYNRWGELVFESTDPEELWDGTYKDFLVQDGVYSWLVRFVDSYKHETRHESGHVMLMR